MGTTTPLHTTRPKPYRTLQHLAHAELITPARKVVAGVLGGCGACGVRSRLLEMAGFRVPPAGRGNLKEGVFNHSVQVESTRLNAESNR